MSVAAFNAVVDTVVEFLRTDPDQLLLSGFRKQLKDKLRLTGVVNVDAYVQDAEVEANKRLDTPRSTPPVPDRDGYKEKLRSLQADGEANLVGVDWGTVDFSPVDWLWDGKIPFGHLTLFAGRGGTGKSTIMIDVAARISKAKNMPDDSSGIKPATTLIIDAENGPRLTGPRLLAADADLGRIQFVDAPEVNFHLKHVEQLRRGIETYKPKLVVIDPLAAMVQGVDMHKEAEVREVLKHLQKLAEEFGIALVIIAHLRKMQADHAQDQVAGSAGIVTWVTGGDSSNSLTTSLAIPLERFGIY